MKEIDLTNSKKYLSRSSQALASPSTFSKVQLFSEGATPFCLSRGEGPYTWDVDGNKYIDFLIGLGCITLRHNHPKVTEAIREQLANGSAFSLPTALEIEVAEMLIERIASAQLVRFGKNGNDVTSAAVRISRHVTGCDHVLFCGYHGWQDWYISQTSKNAGIPSCVGELSHRFVYNDFNSLTSLVEQYKGKVACIIMEPVAKAWPEDNFLEKVREIATKNNIILIFDEVVTGYRFHKAGVQSLLNVMPDLSCFSKAMANGMPLSVLVGKKEIMSKFDEVFFSLTNAGETLSLAAAKAVIKFHDEVDVTGHLNKVGGKLKNGIKGLIHKHDLNERMGVAGFDCRFSVVLKNSEPGYDSTQDYVQWTQLAASCGLLTNGSYMVSYAHTDQVIDESLEKHDQLIKKIKNKFHQKKVPSGI